MKPFWKHVALAAAAWLDGLMIVLTLSLVCRTTAYGAVSWAVWEALDDNMWDCRQSWFF